MAESKKLIALVRPPKPVNEMTDEEKRAFAEELYRLTAARLGDGEEASGERE